MNNNQVETEPKSSTEPKGIIIHDADLKAIALFRKTMANLNEKDRARVVASFHEDFCERTPATGEQ